LIQTACCSDSIVAFGRIADDFFQQYRSLADMAASKLDVCFTPESGHGAAGIEANICLRIYESTPQVRPKK
jgi:hypothetical protein